MFLLAYCSRFTHKVKRLVQKSPSLQRRIDETLEKLEQNPFNPSLSSHKACNYRGKRVYSSHVTKDLRVTWNYRRGHQHIIDIFDIGGHSGGGKVYK